MACLLASGTCAVTELFQVTVLPLHARGKLVMVQALMARSG